MKLKIIVLIIALGCTAFAQTPKTQAAPPPPAAAHEHSDKAKAGDGADDKKDGCACCKKMMEGREHSGMKMDGDKSEKEKAEPKTEKKASCC